jgi:type II secretion system protein N
MSNSKDTISENNLSESIYQNSKGFYIKLVVICSIIFIALTFYLLPLETIIKSKIDAALAGNMRCRVSYEQLHFSYFLPTITLKNTNISKGCLGKKEINLDKVIVKVVRPSFFPFGIKLDVNLVKNRKRVNLDTILGFSKTVIRLNEKNLDAAIINLFLPPDVKIQGKFKMNVVLSVESSKKFSGSFLIRSKNFQLRPMTLNIMGLPLDLPLFKFNTLQLKSSIDNRKMRIENIKIGNSKAPIATQLKGSALLNMIDINYTRINLEGTVRFSKRFRDEFSIINGFLKNKKEENGNYFFKLNGTLKSPKYSF